MCGTLEHLSCDWKHIPTQEMATKDGNVDRIEEDEHIEEGGNHIPAHRAGETDSHHGDEESTHGDGDGEVRDETLDRMLAEMPENVKEAARTWEPQEFLEALSEAVELKKAKKLSKRGPGPSSIEDTDETRPKTPVSDGKTSKRKSSTSSEFNECGFKERVIPVTEVLKIMREERRAERASCELQARRSAIPPRPHCYDGLTSGEHFLEEFTFYIENSGPGKPHQSDFTNSFAAFLTDRAKIWYKRLPSSDQHNWGALVKTFRTDFVDHFREEAKHAYKHRCQGANESVESYSNDMDRLLSTASLPQEEMLAIYVANLRSAIRRHVKGGRPSNIREAERLAREKEADIKESLNYFPSSEETSSTSEDQMLNRLLDRVQALTSTSPASQPEVKKTPKELEEELLSKLLDKIQLIQSKGKPPAKKPTLASLSTGKSPAAKKKGAKARKKKELAQEMESSAQPQLDMAPAMPSTATAPVYQPLQYPYYPGPVLPPMPQFQGPAFYPYPPPGYGSQVQPQSPAQPKPSVSFNQGN